MLPPTHTHQLFLNELVLLSADLKMAVTIFENIAGEQKTHFNMQKNLAFLEEEFGLTFFSALLRLVALDGEEVRRERLPSKEILL